MINVTTVTISYDVNGRGQLTVTPKKIVGSAGKNKICLETGTTSIIILLDTSTRCDVASGFCKEP